MLRKVLHPLHISAGSGAPAVVQCYIECPRGSRVKYELDKESGLLMVDRVLSSAVHYPAHYGFIPSTHADDGDPVDILVIMSEPMVPGCLITGRVLGVLGMVDGGEGDDKVVAVANDDPHLANVQQLSDLPQLTLEAIRVFFKDYKALEKKVVQVDDHFGDKATACALIERCMRTYQEKFQN